MSYSPLIQNVPCTLVTGFLGAGKTTLINQLLSIKAIDERWALLINEFGRIGIDGALFNQTPKDNDPERTLINHNIAIREVSGGCICCTSQLPLQIAITRLLSDHRPQRLIIEPTGLAHPRELLLQLSAAHWQTALKMQAVIAVLSAVQWQQVKYSDHDGFQAHIRDADVVVINRYASLEATCQQQLKAWITTLNPNITLIWATSTIVPHTIASESENLQQTAATLKLLTAPLHQPSQAIAQQRLKNASHTRIGLSLPPHLNTKLATRATTTATDDMYNCDEAPYRYHDKQQDSIIAGWRLPPQWVFAAEPLQQWLLALPHWQRIKGVVHTSDGWCQLNFTPDSLTMTTTSAQVDNRLEIILLTDSETTLDWQNCDRQLMALLTE